MKKANTLSIYFGVPGSGKTTLAAAFTKKYSKICPVYSNVPIKGAFKINKKDIGFNHIQDCLLILDECSIEYNSRAYKDMPLPTISWFKLHRHYRAKCILFSQSWNDCDITLRRLAFDYYIVKPSLIPFFICAVPIRRRISINETTKEPCDEYRFDHPLVRLFTTKRYFAPKYWKMFDSWEAPQLPKKVYDTW